MRVSWAGAAAVLEPDIVSEEDGVELEKSCLLM